MLEFLQQVANYFSSPSSFPRCRLQCSSPCTGAHIGKLLPILKLVPAAMSMSSSALVSYGMKLRSTQPSARLFARGLTAFAPLRTAEPQTSRAEKMMRRFWKTVAVQKKPDGRYEVMLDKRILKTPGGVPLTFESNRLKIALLVAEEWENQVAVLKPHTLPMTSITSRAIDGLTEASTRKKVVASLLKYLDTDTVCFHEDNPPQLVELQDAHWKPLLAWVEERFNTEIEVYEGILNTRQPDATVLALGSVVESYDAFKLAAFERATLASKSYLIALALVEGHYSVDEAARAAHVEVQSQINRWGEVEDTHDVDHQDVRVRLGSAALLCTPNPVAKEVSP